jgi:hypothetical protein
MSDTPSAYGDRAANQPSATTSRGEAEEDKEPSQEEIERRLAALDDFIGSVSHGSLADNIDEELYGKRVSRR